METPTSMITSTGDLGGQKVKMSFDENSLAHLMSVLTDLYSDKEEAVIREYSTNALDAHIEAGNTDPIEVYTPSMLSPYFRVVDKGIGLSVDDITNMYSKYGASSKRGTNDQVGMLGLGAKSALTLVTQFNLTSVKNGVKIFVSISRAADGSGQMEIIDTVSTNEPNGVEIKIPIPRSSTFASKIQLFFRFWKPGTVLVDGKEPSQIDGRWVDDKIVINKNLNKDYIVMGNVAYPVKDGLYGDHRYGYSAHRQMGIVAFVGIGEVNFTPSREDLQYTAMTNKTIAEIKSRFTAKISAAAQKEMDACTTYGAAWRLNSEWQTLFYKGLTLNYKGHTIPESVSIVPVDPQNPYSDVGIYKEIGFHGNNYRYGGKVRAVNWKDSKRLYVYNFAESMKMSPTQREKCAIYCTQNNLSMNSIAITTQKAPVKSAWFDEFTFVDWDKIAPIKVERKASTSGIIRTEPYDLFDGNYSSKQVAKLDNTRPIVYISTAENRYPSHINKMDKDAQVILLSKNRWEKFKRDWPTALHADEWIKARRAAQFAQFTRSDLIKWKYSDYAYLVRGLVYTKIDDPELSEFVRVLNSQDSLSKVAIQTRNEDPRLYLPDSLPIPENPIIKYPLIGKLNSVDPSHAYWYLNNFYAELSKEN